MLLSVRKTRELLPIHNDTSRKNQAKVGVTETKRKKKDELKSSKEEFYWKWKKFACNSSQDEHYFRSKARAPTQ